MWSDSGWVWHVGGVTLKVFELYLSVLNNVGSDGAFSMETALKAAGCSGVLYASFDQLVRSLVSLGYRLLLWTLLIFWIFGHF